MWKGFPERAAIVDLFLGSDANANLEKRTIDPSTPAIWAKTGLSVGFMVGDDGLEPPTFSV